MIIQGRFMSKFVPFQLEFDERDTFFREGDYTIKNSLN